jgi:hypothetical protein
LKIPVFTVLPPCTTSVGGETFTESSFILRFPFLLDVTSRQTSFVLYDPEPCRRARAHGAIPFARNGSEMEEHCIIRAKARMRLLLLSHRKDLFPGELHVVDFARVPLDIGY